MSARAFREQQRGQSARAKHELPIGAFTQPDDVTCGPSCLKKVYGYLGLDIPLDEVIGEIDRNEDGGTLAVFLALAALRRGFDATVHSYDLRIFDPTWKQLGPEALAAKIRLRIPHIRSPKARRSASAYLEFLRLGGTLEFEELTASLLKRILDSDRPILAGLSATHLYSFARERHDPETHALVDDDIAGDPTGHFIVIAGYENRGRRFSIRDPSGHVPQSRDGRLIVDAQRLINSILLGDLTHDAVLLALSGPGAGIGG